MTQEATITIVYPHQLFRISQTSAIKPGRRIIIVEEPLFFTRLTFHKQKILLHRASLQAYKDYLQRNGYEITYLSATDFSDTTAVLDHIKQTHRPDSVHVTRPSDYLLKERLLAWTSDDHVTIDWHDSPLFLTSRNQLAEFFTGKEEMRMANFYRQQRKRLDVLVESDGSPIGGKWSFDAENRESLPTDEDFPEWPQPNRSQYVESAKSYVREHFGNNHGHIDTFHYPVTRKQALRWLDRFFAERFEQFGPYEDAFAKDSSSFLWHSVLTPFLNIGLVTPQEVVDKALAYARKHDVPINSLEGFIRQIIGWREFMHGLYITHGSRIRTQNFFTNTSNMPSAFWSADTKIPPVDRVIEKVLDTGYAHHIERLMVLANYMTLAEMHPHDVYGWFMEMFVDAYDWVMVPNVYAMGLYADGGMMATKPYISSSNYLTKMSDWDRDKDNQDHWSYLWDSLYWTFLDKHQDKLADNYRLSQQLSLLDSFGDGRLQQYRKGARHHKEQLAASERYFSANTRDFFANADS